MKLSKVDITHFRCFNFLTVDLQPDINVIVGANGAGKSSILDAIATALYELVAANGGGGKRQRSLQNAALSPTDIYIDPSTDDTAAGRKPFVQVRATARDHYAVSGFAQIQTEEPATLEWTQHIAFSPPNNFSYETGASKRLSQLSEYFKAVWQEIRASSPQALIPLPAVAYYRAHRHMHGMPELGDIFKISTSRREAFANALDAGADFRSMCQWLYLRENEELRVRADDRGVNQVKFSDLAAIRQALKHTIRGVENVCFSGNPPRLVVEIKMPQGALRILELNQLSDGYRNLLALVLDFARRLVQANPNWPNPLDAPGILLIDEIELHLHPGWQQTIIPSLRSAFPNTQLIVSTHSPAVLTTVRREHIHLLTTQHEFEHLPDDIGTYGAENSRVLTEVFGTHTRPPNIEIVEILRTYLRLVEDREHGTEEAISLRNELESALGRGDADLHRADLRIRQLGAVRKT